MMGLKKFTPTPYTGTMPFGEKKKKKGADNKKRGRGGRAMGGQMYAVGGSVQPTYGSTIADAMPKGTAN